MHLKGLYRSSGIKYPKTNSEKFENSGSCNPGKISAPRETINPKKIIILSVIILQGIGASAQTDTLQNVCVRDIELQRSNVQGDTLQSCSKELMLTIEDLFRLAESSNTKIKEAEKEVEIARHLEKSAEAGKTPEISLAVEASYIGDSYILDRNLSNPTRSPMPHFGNALSLSIYQPLYTGGSLTAGIQKAKNQTRIAESGVEIVSDQIKITVLDYYINLLKYRNLLNVYNENIELTRKLIAEMQARTGQGLVLANDVTRYELNLSNLLYDQLTISNAIEHINYSLVVYLNLPEDTCIIPSCDICSASDASSGPDSGSGLEEWKDEAISSSPLLQQILMEKENNKYDKKLVKSKILPQIGITAGDNFGAPITSVIPVQNKNLNSWWAGLKLTFNISSLYKEKHNMRAVNAESLRIQEKYKAEEENINRNIDQAYRHYLEAQEQIITQKKNVELASENYRIVERRYSADLSLLTDMLDASASKLDAEVRLVNARANVIFYYYQLKYIAGKI